jgi:hypothetical protein
MAARSARGKYNGVSRYPVLSRLCSVSVVSLSRKRLQDMNILQSSCNDGIAFPVVSDTWKKKKPPAYNLPSFLIIYNVCRISFSHFLSVKHDF